MADSSKTEKATPRKRQQAREKGQLTRSRELTSTLSLMAVGAVTLLMACQAAPHWIDFYRTMLNLASTDSIEPNGPILFWTAVEALRWMIPILLTGLLVAVVSGLAQGGIVFSPSALAPNFERLNPANRLQQMFSAAALGPILKSIFPFAAIAWVGYACISSHWNQILSISFSDDRSFASLFAEIAWQLCWKTGIVLLAWSGVDYLLLWMKNESDLKMSRQEIKEEIKSTDGNPATKGRIRKLQRQTRRRQMLKATESATIVITNPTHYAVALRYEPGLAAPTVIAKGVDVLAAKIKQVALDRDIPVMENRSLAQALYKSVDVGDAIPSALYQAVAELLVLVYRAEAELRLRNAQGRAAAQAAVGNSKRETSWL